MSEIKGQQKLFETLDKYEEITEAQLKNMGAGVIEAVQNMTDADKSYLQNLMMNKIWED